MRKEKKVSQEEVIPADSVGFASPQLMHGLTVTELEMLPRLEALKKLDTINVGGSTNISEEVIAAIAAVATAEVEGVSEVGISSLRRTLAERLGGHERKARGVVVEAGSKEAIVDITLRMVYGYSIPATIVQVRQNVANMLLKLCGLVAKEINVRVAGLEFPNRMPRRVR